MKSYYSIALFTLFALIMAMMGVLYAIVSRQDITPAGAAVVALTIIAAMLALRLSQVEKRLAHLENLLENKNNGKEKKTEGGKKGGTG